MTALRGFRIIELAEGVSGEYCGKLLSDFGAEVIKVERPGSGSPTRSMAPIIGEPAGVENSGLFAYLNTNKQSVVLDLATPAGRDSLHRLIASADAVIDDHDEDWLQDVGLSPTQAQEAHPSTVFCSITPFGHGAPREWWSARSLNVFHVSGWGYHTPSAPDCSKPPLKGPGRFLVDYEAALDAALCIVSSLYWRRGSGKGDFIDVSQLDVMISRADVILGRMLAGDDDVSHSRSAYDMRGPGTFFRCADGFVYMVVTNRRHWMGLRKLMGDPDWMARFDPDWLEFGVTDAAVAEFQAGFSDWVRDKMKDEVCEQAQRAGVALVPVNDAADLQRSPQFQFRKYFSRLRHPVLGEALYPTVPYKLSATPAVLTHPAPRLGEHTDAVLQARREPFALPEAGQSRKDGSTDAGAPRPGPLAGVRVLELTKVWAGPYVGKLLAFLGAEVIKIESNANMDEMRAYGGVDPNHAPYFLTVNPEVLSVQLNLKSRKGLELLRGMIARSDIVLNNIRPGAMERMGLGYSELRAIKPDIISVSLKMYGNDGPLGYQTGYAPCFAALGGMDSLVGYEGGPPLGINMRYGDSTVGAAAAFATVAALLHRESTGEGQFIDVSAVECMATMIGDRLFEFALNGRELAPDGNAHEDMAPHGCYPALHGEWISIATASDGEWRRLCEILGQPGLADDSRFRTLALRQANRQPLDELLGGLTASQEAGSLAQRLRAGGVAAFKSQSTLDLVQDPYLWSRGIYKLVSDKRDGSRPIVAAPWRFSRAALRIERGAPDLGEHNEQVYGRLLGLTAEALQELIREGVVD